MELRVLRYFLTVAQEGNITKAAEQLHVTQPTLSRQLIQLEEELGVQLLERGKRHAELTDNGVLFQQRAAEIIALADKAQREFVEQQGSVGGVVAFGCAETSQASVLVNMLSQFANKYPRVRYDLYNGYGNDIKEKMDKGLLDVALLIEPVESSKYDFIRLPGRERWGVLLPDHDELADKTAISLNDISACPLIMPKRSGIRNEIAGWFEQDYDRLNILATYNILSNATRLVSEGLGYAICLEGAVQLKADSHIRFIPLVPDRYAGSVLAWRKKQVFSPATSLFIQFMKMVIRQLEVESK